MIILNRFSSALFSANKRKVVPFYTCWCSSSKPLSTYSNTLGERVMILGFSYECDSMTNVTSAISSQMGRNYHKKKHHPLYLIGRKIQDFFYGYATDDRGKPLFFFYDSFNPIVSPYTHFDSLLIPSDHASRKPTASYYINSHFMLRTHTSAHQSDVIDAGVYAFIVVGDVYRRDVIDRYHYPIIHQVEGVRLFTESTLFPHRPYHCLFEDGERTSWKQACHSMEAVQKMEADLKI